MDKNRAAFTIVELLVVMAIISVLVGVVSLALAHTAGDAAQLGAEAEREILERAIAASMVVNGQSHTAPEECIQDLADTDLDLWPTFVKQRYPGGGRMYSWDESGTVSICEEAIPRIEASFWNNRHLNGEPVLERIQEEINHDWAYGSPDPSVSDSNFSARWHWPIRVSQAGLYEFSTVTDDGVRLYLDGALILDYWVNQPATEHSVQIEVSSGSHDLVMEYFEGGGHAVAMLDWARVETEP